MSCARRCTSATYSPPNCATWPSATGSPAWPTGLLVDLDDFKPVNDRYGHAAGDAVLCEVGRRLRACVRETDTVARLGGDEYGILLESPLPDSIGLVADRIVDAIGQPCLVDGVPVRVGASVGVAVEDGRAFKDSAAFEDSGARGLDELLRAADAAMHRAKSLGKGAAAGYPAEGYPALAGDRSVDDY